ncbi:hypothetical protein SSX86_001847 [Deinandra increscens subsp. villosa]|uniref:Uncharacterized protein n=1 Tax=Deinandra increscens subsp. villosa TaxID=3103831 RepID=A0AAP0HD19_9ASTR
MTKGQCHRRRKMMGRSANGGCGTEEKHCPVSTSRVPNKSSPLAAQSLGIDLYSQACKALAVVSPFDLEDGQNNKSSPIVTTLPAGLASCLSKHADSRKRHKKSNLGTDTKKNKSSSRQEKAKGNSIWSETEDYFRELSVEDVERLNETSSFRGNMFISIPYPRNSISVNELNNNHGVAGGEQQDVNQFMEVDGVVADDNTVTQNKQEDNTAISLPQLSSGVEWLLGSRNKIYLTSERPSKKRKLLGGEAGLEKVFVARPVKDQGASTCCHYCSIGETGNQLNRLIVCKSCGVAVHQRCYGVQQDDGAGCWECSWCRLKRDEDKTTDSHCLLCPQQGGALKPVKKRCGGNDDRGLVEFAHLFCCQWMPEVYIEDTKSMEPIMNIEGIKDVQKKLTCYLCKMKCGACVRCSYGSCRTSFHPVCAREARHRMEIWGKFGCDDVELRAFCSKHSETQKEGGASFEAEVLGTGSNLKSQSDCIDGAEVKGSSTVESVKVSDSNNDTLFLKKLIDRGNVNLNDLASEINVSANLLASNIADDCFPPELHGKIVAWLKNRAHVGGLKKKLKLKVMSTCISKVPKESGGEIAITRASDNNNVGSAPVKLAPSRKKTNGNVRVLKDSGLILSLKRSSADDGVVMDEDNHGGNFPSQESSPDSKEKISPESCPASDILAGNTADHKGSCRTSFHPVCAREARHRMEIWGKFGCDDVELRAFCSKHSETQKEGGASFEAEVLGTGSNLKSQSDCIDGAEVKGSSTVESVKVSDSNNDTLFLKKLIDRGNVNLNDLASEINVSANLLASNIADDCFPPELHGKIVAWLKNRAHVGGLKKKLKLKVMSTCISKVPKESGGEIAITRASDNNNVGSAPVKLAPSRKKTNGNVRVLKDSGLILSLKRSSADDGVVMDEDNHGGNFPSQESSPDSKEKISPESCPASDILAGNTADHKGDTVKCSSPNQNSCRQVDEATNPKSDTRVKSNLANHDCSIAMNPVVIRTEASPGSYIHPLILMQNQVFSKMKADEDDGSGAGYNLQNQKLSSTKSSWELGTTKPMGIINMSPTDEVEGELVYYQHQLLCNAVARKHLSDVLISKVTKHLPEEIETVRRHSWDAVLVSQYLSDLREVKKQGRKERRHKEAQAVLAAATAAAAASSRLSSLRKDTVDESPQQENTLKVKAFGGRSALLAQQVPQAKETHPKLSVTWTSPEINLNSSSSTLENKVHSRACDVCRRAETILNPIIVCSGCKVAVHIDCYRSVKDSTGPWFCELCEDLLSSRSRGVLPRVGECSLCGGTTGAFRKSNDGQWVHAFCAEWILESTFRRGQVKAIEGMDAISKGNDVCLVCSRREGVCIKCNYGHCHSMFHPTCGRNAGFFMNVKIIGGKIHHKSYCEKHSPMERTKAETQKHGAEEWNSLKKVRVELERLRLICERIIRREKLKRELVLCSHDTLRCNRESISSSMRVCTPFVSPDASSESATTSLRGGYTNSYKSCSETIQRSDDITIDSLVAGKRRVRFPMPTAMDNDQKTDDSSTSQIFTQTPTVRPQLAGKQIPQRPSSAVSRTASGDVDRFFRHGKHTETFEKELVMTSDQASMRNQRLPKGFVYVPIRCLSNEEETIAAAAEENSGQDE